MHRPVEHLAKTSLARGVCAAIVARHLAAARATTRTEFLFRRPPTPPAPATRPPLAIRYYQRALSYLDRRTSGASRVTKRWRAPTAARSTPRAPLAPRPCVASCASPAPEVGVSGLLRSAPRFDEGPPRRARWSLGAPPRWRTRRESRDTRSKRSAGERLLRELGMCRGAGRVRFGRCRVRSSAVGTPVPPRLRGEVLRSRGILLATRRGYAKPSMRTSTPSPSSASGRASGGGRVKNPSPTRCCPGPLRRRHRLALESIQIDLSIGGRFPDRQDSHNIDTLTFAWECRAGVAT